MPPVAGVRLASTEAGIRYQGRSDLLLVELAPGSAVAGVFTRSSTASAPVEWSRRAVRGGQVRAILVNSGNANAFTGRAGHKTVARTAEATAYLLGCPRREVLVASTGVIGEPLEAEKILQALPNLGGRLMPRGWPAAARAIMTTDTFPKGATRGARIARQRVVINGIAKGSGMIAPDMATMLAFIFTDARLPAPVLRTLLRRATRRSFNAITVDSDTSTSDTCLLVATGQTSVRPRVASAGDRRLDDFRYALEELMTDLAQQIVRDGEGAQKFVTITVSGARSEDAARRIGLSIGNSPLVKTAIAGEDPNWGRIVMAVGKSGEAADRDGLEIRIGGHLVASEGDVDPNYDEAAVARHMKGRAIAIEVDVAVGRGRATVWTCDLTRGYIEINADYRS
ncbi:MAG: bifunctional glutamate N-acetyltransferase/amino-acid acetyltransferase ArgJ [Alphaproteobacteria bacterium]